MSLCNYRGYGLYMGHILSLFTYLLTTSVSGRVPGYPSYYQAGTRVINYPDTAALHTTVYYSGRNIDFAFEAFLSMGDGRTSATLPTRTPSDLETGIEK